MKTRSCAALGLTVALSSLLTTIANAQTSPAPNTDDIEASDTADQSRPMPHTIGGMPEPPQGYEYTSPLKTIGTDLMVGSYGVSALLGFIYLVAVFPTQALLGHGKPEPVMLWLLLPIAGPWMAQYEDSVKDKPVWRGVLIGDAALQATGLVLGLIGLALSGRRTEPPTAKGGVSVGLSAAGLTISVHTL